MNLQKINSHSFLKMNNNIDIINNLIDIKIDKKLYVKKSRLFTLFRINNYELNPTYGRYTLKQHVEKQSERIINFFKKITKRYITYMNKKHNIDVMVFNNQRVWVKEITDLNSNNRIISRNLGISKKIEVNNLNKIYGPYIIKVRYLTDEEYAKLKKRFQSINGRISNYNPLTYDIKLNLDRS